MADYYPLQKIGLPKSSVRCYEALYRNGPDTAGNLANKLKLSRAGIYQSLTRLEEWGFIEKLNKILPEVTRFRAVRLDKALENLAIYQRHSVRKIVEQQIENSIRSQGRTRTAGRDWR